MRTFPVRVAGETVELDMTPPDRSAAVPGYWASMKEGIFEMRVGQAVRDAVRLIEAGVEPPALAAFVAAFNGERAEWGATHVLPVAADVLCWAARYTGARFAIPLAQLIDLAARDGVRRPARPPAEPVDPGPDPVAAGEALRAAAEAEDAAGAEALLLGALAKGWGRAEIEPWFFRLCADHFLSFGHRLIYQIKCFDLLDAAGWDSPHVAPILRGHLLGVINGTREDVLPAWSGFRRRLAGVEQAEGGLAALYAGVGADPDWAGADAVLAAVTDGKPREAFDAVHAALRDGAPLTALIDALSLGAAERMLRFDVGIDSDPGNQDSWLSVTHIQTYMNAVRHAAARFDHPDVLRMVLFGARFINHHAALDLPEDRRVPTLRAVRPDLEATLAAILSGRTEDALGLALALTDDPELVCELNGELMDVAISDRFSAPIVSAHAMKNLVVAFEEHAHTRDPRSVLAVVRLLASPLQQRWTYRGALEAVAFVTEGKVPTLLAP